ncbi:MAG: hypothetical protein ACR2HH_15405 [Chthoniobacterales bacterium]
MTPTFPGSVLVGQNGVAASLTRQNNSTAPESSGNIVVSQIELVPACGNASAHCVGGADPGVLQLSPTATGRVGTACAGTTFTVSTVDPSTGEVSFQPSGGPVVLGPSAGTSNTCSIDFTFNAVKAPTKDADGATAGLQTDQSSSANGQASVNGNTGSGFGSSTMTVGMGTVGLVVTPTFPAGVLIGQTGVPASLKIKNTSTGPESTGNVTVSQITLVPTCGNASSHCVGGADPGVFQLSPTGTGRVGTACAGTTFTVTTVDPSTGEVLFQANGGPVVLGPPAGASDTCSIDFTFQVVQAPTKDADPPTPGLQTDQSAGAFGQSSVTANSGSGFGTSAVTVDRLSAISIAKSSNNVTVIFKGLAGGSYQVQYRLTLLAPSTWSTVPGPLTADGGGFFTFSETTTDTPKFYRAVQ